MQKLRQLTQEEFWKIYHTSLQKDFPKSEIRAKENLENLWKKNQYLALGWFEKEQFTGYAFFVPVGGGILLLDYFAIHALKRGRGSGGSFLGAFRNYFVQKKIDYIIIEAEDPRFAVDKADERIREKRIAFYKRNNSFFSGATATVLDDHYQILVLPTRKERQHPDLDWASLMESIYKIVFPQKEYVGKIHVEDN